MQFTLSLPEAAGAQVGLVGNKARNLGLLAAEFPVPAGFVITSEAFRLFLQQPQLAPLIERITSALADADAWSADEVAQELGSAVLAADIPKAIMEAVQKITPAGRRLKKVRVAVRSSPAASLPGQYSTVLRVSGEADIFLALKQVWASYWTPRAMSTRASLGIGHFPVEFGVVVQEMVDADAAGILFTSATATGATDKLLIEAIPGVAESLAAGRARPNRFLLDRRTLRPCDDHGDGASRTVPLSDTDLVELARLAMSVEQSFGFTVDVEWAFKDGKFFLLQARQITGVDDESSLGPARDDMDYQPRPADPDTTWTRYWADNFFRGRYSPLAFSGTIWWSEVMNHSVDAGRAYRDVLRTPMFRYHRGRVYTSTEYLKQRLQYEPRFLRTQEVLNHFPPDERESIANAPFKLWSRLTGEARVLLTKPNQTIFRNHQHLQRKSTKILARLVRELDSMNIEGASLKTLLDYRKKLRRLVTEHESEYVGWIFDYKISLDSLLLKLLERWYGQGYEDLMNRLQRGLPEILSVQVALDMWRLSRMVRARPELLESVEQRQPEDLWEAVGALGPEDAFRQAVDQFLAKWGDRRDVMDMKEPCWREEPRYLFSILKATVSLPDERSPTHELRDQIAQREEASRHVESKIRRQFLGSLKGRFFRLVLRYDLAYAVARENQRLVADAIFSRYRRLLLAMGRRLAEAGVLAAQDEVFFLTEPELLRLLKDDSMNATRTVQSRKVRFAQYKSLPPMFLRAGSGEPAVPASDRQGEARAALRGIPASAGVASGTVRILSDLAAVATLREGDVLVASAIDPGWATAFPMIRGLVTEIGGALSHGAILAREFGVPAVIGVEGALTTLADGQMVTVDGYKGEVRLSAASIDSDLDNAPHDS